VAEPKQREKQKASNANAALAVGVVVAGWFVPGLGHLLLGKWGRALVYFLAVSTFAVLGLVLRGNIFSASGGDVFGVLGFLADLGAGVFYFVSRVIEHGGPDVSRAAGDYGTRFFATAGVLNLLCVLDAHEIARGRKV
jgi:TM2 domain-containing membrane protein YozV